MTDDAAPQSADPPAEPTPPTRRIEVSHTVAASREAVWEALATGPGIANWFAPFASVEPGEGGTVTVAWVEGADWPGRIDVWLPGEHLRVVDTSDPEAAAQGTGLVVDYYIEADDTAAPATRAVPTPDDRATPMTVVRAVTSGVPGTEDWDEHVYMMTNGWRFFLWNLAHALERHPGKTRRMISVRPWVTGTRDEVWRRLFGDDWPLTGHLDGTQFRTTDTPFRLDLDGGESLEGKVVLSDRPWAFVGVVNSLCDGVLHVELEGSGDRWKLGVWLSAYGVVAEQRDRVEAALTKTVAKLFPPPPE